MLERMVAKAVYREIVSKRLIEARKAKGYTQDDVTRMLEYKSRGTISHYERGERLNPEELPRLAALYGVSLDWLYGESSTPQGMRKENDVLVTERERVLLENFRKATEREQVIVENILSTTDQEKKLG